MTTPAPAADEKEPLRPLLGRIWRDYLSHHRTPLFLSIACAAVVGVMAATVLQLLEPAIDGLFLGEAVTIWKFITVPAGQALVWIPAIIIGAGLIWTAAALGQAALVNRLGHGIVGDIQVRLFGSMIRADLARLRSQHSGGFVSSVLFDANLVREAFTNGVVNYTQHALTLVAVIGYMAWTDWRLTLIVLLGAPVISLVMRRFGKRMRKATTGLLMAAGQSLRQVTNLQTVMSEGLTAARRLFTALDIEPEIREAPDAAPLADGPVTVAFDRVSFA